FFSSRRRHTRFSRDWSSDVCSSDLNISIEAFISFLDPVDNSTSWNSLQIYENPGEFYSIWGINNTEILVRGYPTMMLYYGTEFEIGRASCRERESESGGAMRWKERA